MNTHLSDCFLLVRVCVTCLLWITLTEAESAAETGMTFANARTIVEKAQGRKKSDINRKELSGAVETLGDLANGNSQASADAGVVLSDNYMTIIGDLIRCFRKGERTLRRDGMPFKLVRKYYDENRDWRVASDAAIGPGASW